jgi:hypothetical protein
MSNKKTIDGLHKGVALILLSALCFQAQAQGPNNQGQPRQLGGSGLGGYTEPTEAGKVPEHLYNVVLGRPTQDSIVASVLFHEDTSAYLAYGTEPGQYPSKTDMVQLSSGQPHDFMLQGLDANTQYYYQLKYSMPGASEQVSDQYRFHTPRSAGSDFVFTVQSDSHLDENTRGPIYLNALANALEAEPDFHLALGDTFMTGKYQPHTASEAQYLAQRYYLGTALTHSAPLFFALGNHDAEAGTRSEEVRTWANATRNKYLPNPAPNDFYTGNTELNPAGDPVRNYYSFEWGNSLFVALDPFRYNGARGDDGNWYMSLGKDQYDWLAETLSESEASFKFVYLHNLIGGAASNRGGSEASWLFEWGGYNFDGDYEFDEKRPGWDQPIHDLLVENGVSIVFHGHDHMYIQQERDGIVYQLVPQPGHPSGNINSAEPYGYLSGNIVAGSGSLRVSVEDDKALVEFIDSRDGGRSGDLLHSYRVEPSTN